VIAWFGPGLLTILGGAIFYLLFPQYFDSTLSTVRQMFESAGQGALVESNGAILWTAVLAQALTGMLVAPVINSLFTFGEEFGWRGYLLQKLMPLGWRSAVLISGVIWGIWHWPIIAMGHNYGLEYAGYPWVGMFAMVWFTILLGIFLSWVTLKARSVWPAVIGHAAINGITALPLLFLTGQPHPAVGPLATGIVGSIAWTVVAALLFFKPGSLAVSADLTESARLETETVSES
jgi:membrane protease YdiL (CAAX protease family)